MVIVEDVSPGRVRDRYLAVPTMSASSLVSVLEDSVELGSVLQELSALVE